MSINSISLFEMLTSLASLIEQLRFSDKAFPITYLLDGFRRYTTTWVVYIEVVLIYHTHEHTLRHVYFSTIEDYLNVIKSLYGVTRSSIRNVCSEFGIYIPQLFLLFSLHNCDI